MGNIDKTMRRQRYSTILRSFLIILSIVTPTITSFGQKTGIGIYKSYGADNYQTIYTDSLISFRTNVYAMSYNNDIYIHFDNTKINNQDLIIDSLSALISYNQESKETANYILKKYFIRLSPDSAYTVNANNSQSNIIKGFRQKTKQGEYELNYFDKSIKCIPKSIKKIFIEIYVDYSVGRHKFVKTFKVELRAKKRLWIQVIPKC